MGSDVKQLVRAYFDVVWNRGELDRVDEFVHASFVDHGATFPFVARGAEGLRRVVEALHVALPDLLWSIEEMIAEEGRVAVRLLARGTHRGALVGFPASGRRVTITATAILRVEGGRIAGAWTQWDTLGLLQEIGVANPTESPLLATVDVGHA